MKKRALLCMALLLSLTACGGEKATAPVETSTAATEPVSTTVENTSVQETTASKSVTNDFNETTNQIETISNVSYQIPGNWSKKPSNNGGYYYYSNDGMLYVSSISGSFDITSDDSIEQYLSGVKQGLANYDDEKIFKITAADLPATKVTFTCDINDIACNATIIMLNCNGGATIMQYMSPQQSVYDYSDDLQKITESITYITSAELKADELTVKFEQIQNDMSYEDVVAIMGVDGSNISSTEVSGVKIDTYQWLATDGISNITIITNNGVVTSKNQVNMNAERAAITMEMYNNIQNGMTYEQVKEIIGVDGQVMSDSNIAGIQSTMYNWNSSKGLATLTVMFQNDAVVSKSQYGLQ